FLVVVWGFLKSSPTLSVPHQWVVLDTKTQLKCHADGFYPPPVSFSWTRAGEVIQPPYQVEVELTPDGYYRAVGNLTFYPSHEDQNVTFGCKVSHTETRWELQNQTLLYFKPRAEGTAWQGGVCREPAWFSESRQ
uniref:Ig-like domain-containing protein n=1 Tax=Astatotilapia calliptera TaxID=8154 RepID=A0AAX7U442_ASTCA